MSQKAVTRRLALGAEEDLVNPSSTQKYPLGYRVEVEDSDTKTVKEFIYVKSHGALTAYVPYFLSWSSTSAAEVVTAACATSTSVYRTICVPQVAFTSGYYGFVQTKGDALCNIAVAPTVGHFLEVVGNAVTVMTTEGAATYTTSSVAVAKEADTTAADIFLMGREVFVAAT